MLEIEVFFNCEKQLFYLESSNHFLLINTFSSASLSLLRLIARAPNIFSEQKQICMQLSLKG
jgi:hypothetical protein